MKEKFQTTGEAARELDLSSERVRQLERAGILRAIKTRSGTRLFKPQDIARLAAERSARKAMAGAEK